MKNYQYQILRYYPDVVAEEFINVGVIFFIPEDRELFSRIIENSSRLSSLYHGIDTKFVIKLIKNIDNWITTKGKELLDQLNHKDYTNIDSVTRLVLPPNDSSLRFSDVRSGITLDVNETFEDLFKRFVSKFEKKNKSHSKDDKKAWEEYKKVFKKYSIDKKLTKPDIKVKTEFLEFEFEHAWKNGKWNFYKPISFDLTNTEHIKKKALELSGLTQELLTSNLNFNLTYLALSPKVDDINYLNDMLNARFNKKVNNKSISIVFENNADEFASQLSLELKEYRDNS